MLRYLVSFRIVGRRIWYVLAHYPVQPVELALALFAGALGAWLVLPVNTFCTSTVFAVLTQNHISELSVGLWFLLVGGLQLRALGTDSRRLRHSSSMLMAVTWFFWALLLAKGTLWLTSTPTYSCFALLSAWALMRQEGRMPL